MKIVFIVQQLSQPRCVKRINTIWESGHNVKVYGYDNDMYSDNLKNYPFPIERIIKRRKEDSKLKKIWFFIKNVRDIIKENEGAVFYLFGFELGTIGRLFGCKHYIYEEADVSAARYTNKIVRNILLATDRKNIKKSLLTIFTSEGFIKYLFPQQAPENFVLLPNKLNVYFDEGKRAAVQKKTIDYNHIKFGFVGLIRYPNTIFRFAKVVGREFPQHEFHFYGQADRDSYIDDEIKGYSNVFFHGKYQNPQGVTPIYEDIDINIVCYDITSGNVRIAEPNKLYESIYFYTPIVVSKDTFLEERVKYFGVGDAIDASKDQIIIEYVKGITKKKMDGYIMKMKSIETAELIDNTGILIDSLSKIEKQYL